jgi:hypothetical protein
MFVSNGKFVYSKNMSSKIIFNCFLKCTQHITFAHKEILRTVIKLTAN